MPIQLEIMDYNPEYYTKFFKVKTSRKVRDSGSEYNKSKLEESKTKSSTTFIT